jgi:hypothetical protein
MAMQSQPGIRVISPGRPRPPVRMVTMRTAADEATEDMAAHLAAGQARTREAHEHLAEATAAHAAEAERIRAEAAGRIERAEAQPDAATAQAGAGLERVRADSAWEREELRQVLDGRANVLEEARAELRGRAGREPGHVRAELAEPGRA